ncbi:MAG: ABC-F family ATP-binding cassette domain-containing protein [Clostridiales bacterium]|jgi:ATP-binding cassette subfamily F protein 3|nr:ABC-F family ATP-binding cassette domain-containing protein [Clostridiales bacterium]
MILSVKNLKKSYGADEILTDVSFIIEEKEKAAIVGVNGAGKTTVFKILTGETEGDGGEIYLKKDSLIKYMPQDMTVESEKTIYAEMLTVFGDIIKLEETIRFLQEDMAGKTGGQLESLLEKYHRATEIFEKKNGYEYKSRIRGVLKGLGFTDSFAESQISTLSGGEKTRVALGKLLLSQPDLLLLDEPTNHLDIESVRWLEGYLQNYNGALIIISHDRYFLDKIVGKIIEIENKKSEVYECGYTEFSVKKEINREIELKHYLNQQKEIKRQEEIIRTLKSFNREKSIKRAKSREKLLMKMERIEKPENLPDKIRIILKPRLNSGNDVLCAKDLSKNYNGREIFKNVSFEIKKGEKVALIGPNGIGKTTLLKIIMNQIAPDSGKTENGSNVNTGYYEQERISLNGEKTIFDEISDTYPKMTVTEIRNALAAFVFTGDDVFKTISSLSGGEAGRVKLAKLMLSDSNFLLLDEPTNHLDIYSKDILENAINSYTGTVLYISHDRYFINSTADKILELERDGVTVYLGNYDYYMEKTAVPLADGLNVIKGDKKSTRRPEADKTADEKKRKSEIAKCEREIEALYAEIKNYDDCLEKEEVYTSPEKSHEIYEKKAKAEEKLNEAYKMWERLSEKKVSGND